MSDYQTRDLGHDMQMTIGRKIAVFFVTVGLMPALSGAQVCDVPRVAHPTVQKAIDDPACTTINLEDRSYPESLLIARSLTIVAPAALADIEGFVKVQGSGTVVEITNMMVQNGCTPEAFLVTDGSQVNSTRLEVIWVDGAPCPETLAGELFSDGFELGNTLAWSATVP